MSNLTPTQVGAISVLIVSFQITDPIATNKVIKEMHSIAKLNGITVNINLRTKSEGVATQSMIKPPIIKETHIARTLAIADAAISPHYLSAPKGQSWRQRTAAAAQPIRGIVKKN